MSSELLHNTQINLHDNGFTLIILFGVVFMPHGSCGVIGVARCGVVVCNSVALMAMWLAVILWCWYIKRVAIESHSQLAI